MPAQAALPDDLAQRLDDYLRAEMRANRLPGMVVGIVQGDETLFLRGYGESAPSHPMGPDAQFYIGVIANAILVTLRLRGLWGLHLQQTAARVPEA